MLFQGNGAEWLFAPLPPQEVAHKRSHPRHSNHAQWWLEIGPWLGREQAYSHWSCSTVISGCLCPLLHRFPQTDTVLQLCVTPTPNSKLWSSSETWPLVPHLCDPAHHFRSSDPTLLSWYVFPFAFPFPSLLWHYLTCYSLSSHQWCLCSPSYSSPRFLDICLTPPDFPYTFTIPSGLGKSFVLFSYRPRAIYVVQLLYTLSSNLNLSST